MHRTNFAAINEEVEAPYVDVCILVLINSAGKAAHIHIKEGESDSVRVRFHWNCCYVIYGYFEYSLLMVTLTPTRYTRLSLVLVPTVPAILEQMINLSEAAASSLASDVEYRIHQVIKVLKPQLASNTLSKMS